MEARSAPLVSIITATRNRPRFLPIALRSFAAQSFRDFESIVVDDGSDVSTLEAYAEIWTDLDERFIIEKAIAPGGRGSGPAAARNRGLRRARGEYIAFCDDDDFWRLPDHVEVGISMMKKYDADVFFGNF